MGISRFFTDYKGQYQGNFLNGWSDDTDTEIVKFADTVPSFLTGPIIETISASKMKKLYEGNFGVDTLIFRLDDNSIRINPLLEINLRQNMGQLSFTLKS